MGSNIAAYVVVLRLELLLHLLHIFQGCTVPSSVCTNHHLFLDFPTGMAVLVMVDGLEVPAPHVVARPGLPLVIGSD